MQNTWAKGLNPTYSPMNIDDSRLFIAACLLEKNKEAIKKAEEKLSDLFFIKVLDARINNMKLPIKFSVSGKMAALAMVKVVGEIVVLLIDCLNAFEGKEVTTAEIADLYPNGFYDEKTLVRYIDDYMKPRKVKWSDVYISR